MVKYFPIVGLCLLLLITAIGNASEQEAYAFRRGERLSYKLNYGWFTIGRGSFQVDSGYYDFDGKHCYKVNATGASSGLLKMVAPIDDEWGAYLRVGDLKPVHTYRNLREGRYQLQEKVFIDPDSGTIRVESIKPHRKQILRPTRNYMFDPADKVNDILSGLLTIRNTDFSGLMPGDTIDLKAFLEDTFYDFKVVYAGKEELKTKLGRLNAHKVVPLMPRNDIFDGERSMVAWLSDDQNKLPLKISARMFIGKASVEIVSYQNIKYGPDSH